MSGEANVTFIPFYFFFRLSELLISVTQFYQILYNAFHKYAYRDQQKLAPNVTPECASKYHEIFLRNTYLLVETRKNTLLTKIHNKM